MSGLIVPTVGRKVWYRPADYDNPQMAHDQKQPLDATIVCVHSDRLINAVIFDHNGRQHVKTSVKLLQEGDETPKGGGYCQWMDYQKGQAARTEQAIAALEASCQQTKKSDVAEAAKKGFHS